MSQAYFVFYLYLRARVGDLSHAGAHAQQVAAEHEAAVRVEVARNADKIAADTRRQFTAYARRRRCHFVRAALYIHGAACRGRYVFHELRSPLNLLMIGGANMKATLGDALAAAAPSPLTVRMEAAASHA